MPTLVANIANGLPEIVDGAVILDVTGEEVHPGDLMPALWDSWTVSYEWRFSTFPTAATDDIILDIGMDTDFPYENSGSSYGASLRLMVDGAGSMRAYLIIDGSPQGVISSASMTAPVEGQWIPMTATLTPAGVTWTRTDTDEAVTYADARTLGGYFWFKSQYFRFKSQTATGVIEVRKVHVDPA